MSEKRCGCCRFWHVLSLKYVTGNTYCDCALKIARDGMDGHRHVNFNFGCIHWEQKEPDLREQLAAYAHEAWSGWIEHMFDKGLFVPLREENRWKRLAHTPHSELTEAEKESDRAEADKMIAIFEEWQREES